MFNLNKELKLALGVLLLHMIPLMVMCFPDFPGAFYSPYSGVYSLISWLCIPVLSSIVVIIYMMHGGRLSWLSGMELVVVAVVYTTTLRDKDTGLFCTGLILLLGLELFPNLNKPPLKPTSNGFGKIMAEMSESWKFLALVYFWSVLFIFSVQWLLMGNSQYTSFGVVAFAGLLPIIMLMLPRFLERPLLTGGWLGILLILATAICVCFGPYSGGCWGIYLAIVLIGFAIMSVRLCVKKYNKT